MHYLSKQCLFDFSSVGICNFLIFDDAKWQYPSEGSQGAGLLWQGRSICCTQTALSDSCHPSPECCLTLGGAISKQSIVSASSDFNEEQRNYSHKFGNTFFGVFSAYVFGVFFPFSPPLLRLVLCINIKSLLLCFRKTNPSRDT